MTVLVEQSGDMQRSVQATAATIEVVDGGLFTLDKSEVRKARQSASDRSNMLDDSESLSSRSNIGVCGRG